MVLNVFIEKNFDKFVQKLHILCNTEVLPVTIFHYTIVIHLVLLLNKFIIKFWNSLVQNQLLV